MSKGHVNSAAGTSQVKVMPVLNFSTISPKTAKKKEKPALKQKLHSPHGRVSASTREPPVDPVTVKIKVK